MNYKGIELVEVTEPQIFDPPKEMLVWDDCDVEDILKGKYEIKKVKVYGIIADTGSRVISLIDGSLTLFENCANIPEEPKPRRATWKELAYWLIDGKGLVFAENRGKIGTGVIFRKEDLDAEVSDCLKVMRRDDADWHEPTADYMNLEEK